MNAINYSFLGGKKAIIYSNTIWNFMLLCELYCKLTLLVHSQAYNRSADITIERLYIERVFKYDWYIYKNTYLQGVLQRYNSCYVNNVRGALCFKCCLDYELNNYYIINIYLRDERTERLKICIDVET